ncbi:MAG TPA: nucleotidyltransferase family protein [Vicinamibacterales bacterium]|nr:nucleotidyltransferase family protein [Vicinamibacterales bacterium]HPW21566.1 nucleotidyltransferase family protein [Vicinamibacterales bacterium]
MTIDDVRLIVRLVRGRTAEAAERLESDPDALDRLAAAAATEGLAVVLLRALGALPAGFSLSGARLEQLESKRRLQSARSAALAASLDRLARAFIEDGLPFLLLKGPYLAARFYGDADGREYVDLDLLVPRAGRARAWRLLENAGFARRSRALGGERLASFFVHAYDFAGRATGIDIHWRLTRQPSVRVDEDALWAGAGSFALGGRTFGVLSDAHEVAFHALSLLRDIERGRPKAKNIVDLVQIAASLDAAMDWDALLDAGRSDGTFGPMVNVLALCLDAAGAHGLAPRLAQALSRCAGRRGPARALDRPGHFAPAWMAAGNRWWAARAYDTSVPAWLLWWAVSLPFRAAARRPLAPPAGPPAEPPA